LGLDLRLYKNTARFMQNIQYFKNIIYVNVNKNVGKTIHVGKTSNLRLLKICRFFSNVDVMLAPCGLHMLHFELFSCFNPL